MKQRIKDLIIFAIILGFMIFLGWRIAEQVNHFIWGYTGG